MVQDGSRLRFKMKALYLWESSRWFKMNWYFI